MVEASLKEVGLEYEIYSGVSVEPTDVLSSKQLILQKRGNLMAIWVLAVDPYGYVKAANLYATYPPEDFLDYVNPPIGKGNQFQAQSNP